MSKPIMMAETRDVPQWVEQLDGLRFWANPILRRIIETQANPKNAFTPALPSFR